MAVANDDPVSSPFDGLLPRRETQALQFVTKYPNYDGSNVLIGILDTGVDPGAAGIRYMKDGTTPKLIDIVDCTGSGDVDITTEKVVEEVDNHQDNIYYQVKGLSGRLLKLKKSWWRSIPSSKKEEDSDKTEGRLFPPPLPTVKLGIKPAFELFPSSLVNRVKAHRKKIFDQECNAYIANVQKDLAAWQDKFVAGSKKPTPDDVRTSEDLQAKLDILMDKEWESEDPGMILDCVVFHDGEQYRAVLYGGSDKEEEDVEKMQPLAAYSKERQYGTISTVDQYNYGVNFYDDATVLSIVGDCTPHGTHVASIAAVAEGPDRSGVAPGAQLVSIKIGDSRLGSMETTSSLARGILTAIRLGCDVINLSYGEGCQVPNAGRVIQLAEELVWRYNIVFVAAVGNNGPALSTVNAPGGMSSCILGVAAYVSPEMMKSEYSLTSNTVTITADDGDEDNNRFVGSTYTWSSVGPTADGSNGVCVCAPGGAITSVSNWTMQKSMLMNGTSMASPHACGCVALLLSACKAEGIPISPSRIQRAIENTAKSMPGSSRYQQGWGMVQVEEAYKYLQQMKTVATEDMYFEVYIDNQSGSTRGVYIRQPEESSIVQTFSVCVKPNFKRVDNPDDAAQKDRIDFEMQFAISVTAPWVLAPDTLMLMNNGRNFKIDVDPRKLPHGVHTANVNGHVIGQPDRGPMWSLPITVVKPLEVSRIIEQKNIELKPTEVARFFVVPPPGCTWMDVTVRDCRTIVDDPNASSRLFVLHTVQLIPHAAYRDYAVQKYLNLLPNQTCVTSVPVESGITCEVDLARFWSAAGNVKADLCIEFRGVQPNPTALSMRGGDTFGVVRVESVLMDETINPSAKFTKWRTPIRPKTEGTIKPLGERDILPWNGKKIYQMQLNYEFSQDDKGSFTPIAPALQEILYESTYESQMMMIYDGEKRYLGCVDAYPSAVTASKGSVCIQVQIRHDDPKMLEKLKDMTIWIERKLEKEISLSAYSTREDLLEGKRAMKKRMLRKGLCESVFFTEPSSSKFPSSCKAGDILMGSASYCSGESSLPGDGKRPNGFPIVYTVGPKFEKPADPDSVAEPKDERTAKERIDEAVRDLRVEQLGKLTSTEKEKGDFESLYGELEKAYPQHIPLLMAKVKYLDGLKAREENLPKIVAAADKVLAEISEEALALHFGKKLDKEDPQQVKKNKDMEKQKGFLVDALARQAFAHAEMTTDDAKERFAKTLDALKAWVDIDSNGKYAGLALERDCRAGRHGLALKRINKLLAKTNGKDTGGVRPLTRADLIEKRVKIFEHLGYHGLVKREKAMKLVASPTDYKLF
ncbi:tripeptidyl-peptidase II [Nitzschia inconspicua]|uniref:Tripeptidyl-peptidase II n=1 Tax=Nitzschia inconspicua TaxID=303405 RepID=A0A9K3LQ58_9STRA|nr:tripeptidyl-peptidase II [Nitzschia inconspicua]